MTVTPIPQIDMRKPRNLEFRASNQVESPQPDHIFSIQVSESMQPVWTVFSDLTLNTFMTSIPDSVHKPILTQTGYPRMSFRKRLHYLLLGASEITRMVPKDSYPRSADELAKSADATYRRLDAEAERRMRG